MKIPFKNEDKEICCQTSWWTNIHTHTHTHRHTHTHTQQKAMIKNLRGKTTWSYWRVNSSRQILMGHLCSHGRGMLSAIGISSSSVRLLAWTKCNLTSLHRSNKETWGKNYHIPGKQTAREGFHKFCLPHLHTWRTDSTQFSLRQKFWMETE